MDKCKWATPTTNGQKKENTSVEENTNESKIYLKKERIDKMIKTTKIKKFK